MIASDWLFGVSALILLYHFVVYPALIQVVARLVRTRTEESRSVPLKVSILIPAYNEEVTISAKLRNTLELKHPAGPVEIIVGSDASTDRTDTIVSSFGPDNIYLARMPCHGGNTAVLNHLAARAKGELLLFTDADVLLERDCLSQLTGAFSDPHVGLACVRYKRRGQHGHGGEGLYDRYESWIKSKESQIGAVVGIYGAGIMLRRECWRPLPSDTILGDMWIGSTTIDQGLKVVQVNTAVARGQTESPAGEFRRKVRNGRGSLQAVFRRPWLYLPWAGLSGWILFSHKGLRLLIPWLMLAMLAGSAIGAFHTAHHQILLAFQLAVWLTTPLIFWHRARAIRWLLAPQYLLAMSMALGLGECQFLLQPSRVAWDRAPRAAAGNGTQSQDDPH